MILVELDNNAILCEPMKNITSEEMIQEYQVLVDRLNECGIKPKQHFIDTEYLEKF